MKLSATLFRLVSVLAIAAPLGLVAPALTGCADSIGDDELSEAEEGGGDDGKSDRADLALTPVEFSAPVDAGTSRVGVIKSRAAFQQVFGAPPPAGINFSSQWVAYYTAGLQSAGGYTASIQRIRLSDTGKTIKIDVNLDAPGAGCAVSLALTTPYAIVKFNKPFTQPSTSRYTRRETTTDCTMACAGRVEKEAHFTALGDGLEECATPIAHCLTNDWSSCPQFDALPPDFCVGGTVHSEPGFTASADGMECALPSPHCVTNDSSACPQLSPLPPNYCPTGTTLQTTFRFQASSDGKECMMPTAHCVLDAASDRCSQF